jgi:hypothetical protein
MNFLWELLQKIDMLLTLERSDFGMGIIPFVWSVEWLEHEVYNAQNPTLIGNLTDLKADYTPPVSEMEHIIGHVEPEPLGVITVAS